MASIGFYFSSINQMPSRRVSRARAPAPAPAPAAPAPAPAAPAPALAPVPAPAAPPPLVAQLARFSISDSTALLYTDETRSVRLSYAEVWERAGALARALQLAARARPPAPVPGRDGGCVVAVCMHHTHETVLALLACWKAGAAYLPLSPDTPPQRISHILQDSQPTLVIYDSSCSSSMFAGSGFPSVSFEELSREAGELSDGEADADTPPPADSRADADAIVLYTTGTTGLPKGVRIPYSAICNRLLWQFREFPYTDTEVFCVWKTAMTFVDSVCEIWGPLLQGRSLLILPRGTTSDPHKLVQVLSKNQVQRLVLVPTLLRSILMYLSLNNSERPLQALKLWVCSGETLSKELATQFFQYFGDDNGYRLANFYGSTEVMGDVTHYVLESTAQLDLYDNVPIGSPIDHCEVYLLDTEMRPVSDSEVGEIWVAGANLARGYVGEGEHSSDKFLNNPCSASTECSRVYRTGDFGMVQKGVLLYAGRTDSQVKIRGHRVDLREVESAVVAVEGVQTAVVVCFGLAMGSPEILAFVTLEPAAKTSLYDIKTVLQNSLVSYMLPQVIIIEFIPLLINGKVDKQTLLKMYEDQNKCEIDYLGVDSDRLEKTRVVMETVGEVVGGCAGFVLSAEADFYRVGGNSLNTILVTTRLRDKGYHIEISDFLEAANLGEVVSKLSTSPDGHGDWRRNKFTAEPMRHEHKQDVMRMVNSFSKKAALDRFLRCRINNQVNQEYDEGCSNAFWPALLCARLSIVLTDASGTLVAVALNSDAHDDELKIKLPSCAFIYTIEDSVRETMIPQGKGKVLQNFLMATAEHLSARDNVAAVCTLEHETVQLARDRGFRGVFTTNSSPLTQQLAVDVIGYQTLLDYQVNQYVDSRGDRIFEDAPDNIRVLVCWKPVEPT